MNPESRGRYAPPHHRDSQNTTASVARISWPAFYNVPSDSVALVQRFGRYLKDVCACATSAARNPASTTSSVARPETRDAVAKYEPIEIIRTTKDRVPLSDALPTEAERELDTGALVRI